MEITNISMTIGNSGMKIELLKIRNTLVLPKF